MKHRTFFTGVVSILLVSLTWSCAVYAQEAVHSAIEAANRRLEAGVVAGDGQAVGALYTHDAQLLPPNRPTIEGRTAISEAMQRMIDMGVKRLNLKTEEVRGTGESAYEIGRYRLYGNDDEALDEGKYTLVWQQENGTWKVRRHIWNSDRPLSSAKPRANNGELVGIALYQVKSGRQAAFEQFVHEVLWPAASKVEPESSQRVRFWNSVEEGQEGTSSYAFVFDPRLKGADYSISSLLERAYGPAIAQKHMADFRSHVDNYSYKQFIQSK